MHKPIYIILFFIIYVMPALAVPDCQVIDGLETCTSGPDPFVERSVVHLELSPGLTIDESLEAVGFGQIDQDSEFDLLQVLMTFPRCEQGGCYERVETAGRALEELGYDIEYCYDPVQGGNGHIWIEINQSDGQIKWDPVYGTQSNPSNGGNEYLKFGTFEEVHKAIRGE